VSTLLKNHDRRLLLPDFVDYGIQNHEAISTENLRKVSSAWHSTE
jgi:hypothetical protein